jgi:hypothetical protein
VRLNTASEITVIQGGNGDRAHRVSYNVQYMSFHQRINRCERLCTLCKMNVVEDEYHFLRVCPVLRNIRIACLKPFLTMWPTINKFSQLMSDTSNSNILRLRKYICKASELRNNLYAIS